MRDLGNSQSRRRRRTGPGEKHMRALQHRGPDGSRTWQSQDRSVSVAYSRLAINDVSNGGQPISNEDGSIVAVVNGEFYDLELFGLGWFT